jgi:hypothetical protein
MYRDMMETYTGNAHFFFFVAAHGTFSFFFGLTKKTKTKKLKISIRQNEEERKMIILMCARFFSFCFF